VTYLDPLCTISQDLISLSEREAQVFHEGGVLIHVNIEGLGFRIDTTQGIVEAWHTGSILVNEEGVWICLEDDISISDDIVYIEGEIFEVETVKGPIMSLNEGIFSISTSQGSGNWLRICPLNKVESLVERALVTSGVSSNISMRLNELIIQAARKFQSK